MMWYRIILESETLTLKIDYDIWLPQFTIHHDISYTEYFIIWLYEAQISRVKSEGDAFNIFKKFYRGWIMAMFWLYFSNFWNLIADRAK